MIFVVVANKHDWMIFFFALIKASYLLSKWDTFRLMKEKKTVVCAK